MINLRKKLYVKPLLVQDREVQWKNKKGKLFYVCNMDHGYIVNCIQFLTKKIISFEKEIIRRKRYYFLDESINEYKKLQDDCENWIKIFENELMYREQENEKI